eukprot:m.164082 g.164082  ORF g.164082 m.164082 type:complete len:177 (+) comp13420_c0_seq6:2826-3356(+)
MSFIMLMAMQICNNTTPVSHLTFSHACVVCCSLQLDKLLQLVFLNEKFVVLAFSFVNDFVHLLPLCPSLEVSTKRESVGSNHEKSPTTSLTKKEPKPRQSSFVRVRDLQLDIKRTLRGKKKLPSLGKACEIAFKKCLNKAEQCSNWERRPLRQEQLHYAAIDSWCLFGIANHLDTS